MVQLLVPPTSGSRPFAGTPLREITFAVCHIEPATKKPGRNALSGFFGGAAAARLLPLQLEDFILDAELLALQIVDRLLVG
jgi:hypothetical protein